MKKMVKVQPHVRGDMKVKAHVREIEVPESAATFGQGNNPVDVDPFAKPERVLGHGEVVGLPRPRAHYAPMEGRWTEHTHPYRQYSGEMPVPWILQSYDNGGQKPEKVSVVDGGAEPAWTEFSSDRSHAAFDEQLCQVCGNPLGKTKILLAGDVKRFPHERPTSGPPCHPKCALLSLKYCPNLRKKQEEGLTLGWVYQGNGRGYHEMDEGEPFTMDNTVDESATEFNDEDILKRLVALDRSDET